MSGPAVHGQALDGDVASSAPDGAADLGVADDASPALRAGPADVGVGVKRTGSSRPAVELRLVFDDDFERVLPDWRTLQAEGHCTAFQTEAWMRPFYRDLAPALGLTPVFLRAVDVRTGRPLMLCPLVHHKRKGLAHLTWADEGVSDYNAPLLAADWPPQALPSPGAWHSAWAQLCQHLRALPGLGAVLRLDKAPPRVGPVANPLLALVDATRHLPMPYSTARAAPQDFGAWAVNLPDCFEAYQRQALSPSMQKDLALRQRRLARKGPVRFALATTTQARQTAFDTMARQRARRFAEVGRPDILADAHFRRFYEAAAVHAPGQTVRLFTLSAGDTVVAVLLALDHAGTRHVVMPTFEAGDWKNCSPGNLILLMAIDDAIAHGLRCFDFTIGDESYKALFGATRQPVFRLTQPLSPGGMVLAGAHQGARRARDWWRSTAWAQAAQPPATPENT